MSLIFHYLHLQQTRRAASHLDLNGKQTEICFDFFYGKEESLAVSTTIEILASISDW